MEAQEKFIKLLNTDIIAVEVPTETKVCDCDFICGYCKELWNLDPNFDYHKIGESTEDEISFDVEPYVEQNEFDVENCDGLLVGVTKFWDYEDESFYLIDKNESFRSLVQASGLNWANPFSNKCKRETPPSKDFEHLKQWQEAERKLIKGKLIFLKIIK